MFGVRCIKDEDQRVLAKEENKVRWKSYFDKLFNVKQFGFWIAQIRIEIVELFEELG